MAWWGKALGGAFGFMVGGPFGALMGVAFGHNFDRGMKSLGEDGWQDGEADQNRIQAAFFTATFSVMGYIAKADGKVTRDEIKLAEEVLEIKEKARLLTGPPLSLFPGNISHLFIDRTLPVIDLPSPSDFLEGDDCKSR